MSNGSPFSNSLALGARLRPRGVKVRAVRECVTCIRVYRSVHRGVADEVSVVFNVFDGGWRRSLSLLRTPAHSVRCGLLAVFSAVVMDPVVLNPVMPSTAPGALFVCSPGLMHTPTWTATVPSTCPSTPGCCVMTLRR